MSGQGKDCRRKKKLCFSTFNGIIFLFFEQRALHFHFALGHANCVVDLEVHAKNSKTIIHMDSPFDGVT